MGIIFLSINIIIFFNYCLRATISNYFTEAERNRFRNLLELANDSKYSGERENALAAATRIAQKYNMTLDEAAGWKPDDIAYFKKSTVDDLYQRPRKATGSSSIIKNQQSAEEEKKQWQTAMNEAKERGLDKAENAKKAAQEAARSRRHSSKSRRNPVTHANILLKETSLSFEEISDITGLDVYKIITMKLKSRSAA
jgi:hypothetical protein